MNDRFRSTVQTIHQELDSPQPDREKLALLARAMRWQVTTERDVLQAVLRLGERVRGKSTPGFWAVEQAVLEIFCDHAQAEHLPFLLAVFRTRGKHGDDRRRLALQGLSRIAAHTAHQDAFQALESGLHHPKQDTRGWAIGFIASAYAYRNQPLPISVTERLWVMALDDKSMDVRVEAATTLAEYGLVPPSLVQEVIAEAQAHEDHP